MSDATAATSGNLPPVAANQQPVATTTATSQGAATNPLIAQAGQQGIAAANAPQQVPPAPARLSTTAGVSPEVTANAGAASEVTANDATAKKVNNIGKRGFERDTNPAIDKYVKPGVEGWSEEQAFEDICRRESLNSVNKFLNGEKLTPKETKELAKFFKRYPETATVILCQLCHDMKQTEQVLRFIHQNSKLANPLSRFRITSPLATLSWKLTPRVNKEAAYIKMSTNFFNSMKRIDKHVSNQELPFSALDDMLLKFSGPNPPEFTDNDIHLLKSNHPQKGEFLAKLFEQHPNVHQKLITTLEGKDDQATADKLKQLTTDNLIQTDSSTSHLDVMAKSLNLNLDNTQLREQAHTWLVNYKSDTNTCKSFSEAIRGTTEERGLNEKVNENPEIIEIRNDLKLLKEAHLHELKNKIKNNYENISQFTVKIVKLTEEIDSLNNEIDPTSSSLSSVEKISLQQKSNQKMANLKNKRGELVKLYSQRSEEMEFLDKNKSELINKKNSPLSPEELRSISSLEAALERKINECKLSTYLNISALDPSFSIPEAQLFALSKVYDVHISVSTPTPGGGSQVKDYNSSALKTINLEFVNNNFRSITIYTTSHLDAIAEGLNLPNVDTSTLKEKARTWLENNSDDKQLVVQFSEMLDKSIAKERVNQTAQTYPDSKLLSLRNQISELKKLDPTLDLNEIRRLEMEIEQCVNVTNKSRPDSDSKEKINRLNNDISALQAKHATGPISDDDHNFEVINGKLKINNDIEIIQQELDRLKAKEAVHEGHLKQLDSLIENYRLKKDKFNEITFLESKLQLKAYSLISENDSNFNVPEVQLFALGKAYDHRIDEFDTNGSHITVYTGFNYSTIKEINIKRTSNNQYVFVPLNNEQRKDQTSSSSNVQTQPEISRPRELSNSRLSVVEDSSLTIKERDKTISSGVTTLFRKFFTNLAIAFSFKAAPPPPLTGENNDSSVPYRPRYEPVESGSYNPISESLFNETEPEFDALIYSNSDDPVISEEDLVLSTEVKGAHWNKEILPGEIPVTTIDVPGDGLSTEVKGAHWNKVILPGEIPVTTIDVPGDGNCLFHALLLGLSGNDNYEVFANSVKAYNPESNPAMDLRGSSMNWLEINWTGLDETEKGMLIGAITDSSNDSSIEFETQKIRLKELQITRLEKSLKSAKYGNDIEAYETEEALKQVNDSQINNINKQLKRSETLISSITNDNDPLKKLLTKISDDLKQKKIEIEQEKSSNQQKMNAFTDKHKENSSKDFIRAQKLLAQAKHEQEQLKVERYIETSRNATTYCGNPQIIAISKQFNVPIRVYNPLEKAFIVHNPNDFVQPITIAIVGTNHFRFIKHPEAEKLKEIISKENIHTANTSGTEGAASVTTKISSSSNQAESPKTEAPQTKPNQPQIASLEDLIEREEQTNKVLLDLLKHRDKIKAENVISLEEQIKASNTRLGDHFKKLEEELTDKYQAATEKFKLTNNKENEFELEILRYQRRLLIEKQNNLVSTKDK